MIRALLCTAALTVALTAAHAEAGGFKLKFGGGKHGISWNHGKHHNNHHHYRHKVRRYHAPAAKCYYQVCFHCDAWGYKKYEVFDCLSEARAFAHRLEHRGYYVTITKTCSPYPSGHKIYKPLHNHHHWLP